MSKHTTRTRRIRLRAVTAAAALVASAAAAGWAGAPASQATPSTPDQPFAKTVVATRSHVIDGVERPVESKTVALTVDRTSGLRDQQSISVHWTGAHPTGNASIDPNSGSAFQAEYPMVLLQCRGVDSPNVAATQRLDPTTCWSPFYGSRSQLNGYGPEGRFPAWRLDRFADPLDRQQFAREPAATSPLCPNDSNAAEHRLPFVAADGSKYYGAGIGDSYCGASPPEAATVADADSLNTLPDNASFARTATDGTGTFLFNVRDNRTNASLGCSESVPCALVAIPIMGISCDPAAVGLPAAANDPGFPAESANAVTGCMSKGQFPPGSLQTPGGGDLSVSGGLWWSASNWRNRITVPLQFAPPDNVCDLVSKKTPVNVFGSELMIQATTQWSAKFCLDASRSPFKHIQLSEPQARTLLSIGNVNAAFVSQPPDTPFPNPTVQAPVAVTGFALSYNIDDKNNKPYTSLKLTPRLIAKLLTESYPGTGSYRSSYSYHDPYLGAINPLAANPFDITRDPEFQALNPGVPEAPAYAGPSALLSIGSDSDVLWSLTAYLNADPEARAWLDGTPDPWGMRVNPNYRRIALPVNAWPLLDTWTTPNSSDPQACDRLLPKAPVLPLIGAPLQRLADITTAVQYAIPGSQTGCKESQLPTGELFYQWVRVGKEQPGRRFLIGLTSLGDAARYRLNTAALQTSSSQDPAAKFTDTSGRTFAAPSNDSLLAASKLLHFAAATGTWPIPYADLRKSAAAYPGLMLVYAEIGTTKLTPATAKAYSEMLSYLAGPAQVPGSGIGQLPAGYLPMTAANGLGDLATATSKAAAELARFGTSGPIASHPSAPATAGPGTSTGSALPPTQSSSSSSAAPKATATQPSGSTTSPALKSLGNTAGQSNGAATALLALLIVLLLLGPVAAPALVLALRVRARR